MSQKRKSTSSLSQCWLRVEKGCSKSENQQAHCLNAGSIEKGCPKSENQQAHSVNAG